MNKIEYLLTCAMEECSEIQKDISKSLRFGLDNYAPNSIKSNKENIVYEFIDLLAVINMLYESKALDDIEGKDLLVKMKQQKIKRYMEISKELGFLKEE